MGRRITLLSWELNDPIRVLITTLGILVTGYIFQHSLLTSTGEIGTVSTSVNGLNSMSGFVIARAITSEDFWIIATFFIAMLVTLTFRAGIEGRYELTTYSLPYSKSEIFAVKLLVSFLLSLLVVFVPFFVLVSINFAETPKFVLSLFTGERFMALLIVVFMAIFYILSLTLFLSVTLRNMFAVLVFAFPLLVIPYFVTANLPPGNLLRETAVSISTGEYFTLSQFLLQPRFVVGGLVVPLMLTLVSFVIILWRDVR
ncbi:hypothetical protein [Thermococcus nautili]|uniref:ABC-type transport system involved in multi-copper enzyme maturation, permease component n=1 Tax=Thermococcus nautili TaxID=195522 RepID=W8NRF7_9EURY|nr:hypothetical protein [Thermococcus nautili]AHL21788.1 hypothetical protein BD01_0157 [Thermococcus nautili]